MAAILEDWQYRRMAADRIQLNSLDFSTPHDAEPVRLYGRVFGHHSTRDGKYVYLSPPAYFNEAQRIVRTVSGSEYKLGRCAQKESAQIALLRTDVLRHVNAGNDAAPATSVALPENAPTTRHTPHHDDDDDEHTDLDALLEDALGSQSAPPASPGSAPASTPGKKIYDASNIETFD